MTSPLPRSPVKVFVAATGNEFMRDIASWLVEAAALAGWPSELVTDELPRTDGSINLVVAPHEFFELSDHSDHDLKIAAAASVCVCTEQPGTPWFHLSVDACRRGLRSIDINPQGMVALRQVGVSAEHLALGAVPSIASSPRDRPIDVVVLAGLDARRGERLAALAPRLAPLNTDLRLFRFDRPVTPTTPGMLFGRAKYDLLASSRVLLNLHRDRSMHLPAGVEVPEYFEWARMIEAMANGCVVVSEPSEGYEPLVAGVHFVEATGEGLAEAIDHLLAHPDERERIAAAAREAVCSTWPLDRALGVLLAQLEVDVVPRLAQHVATSRPTSGLWRLGAHRLPPPVRLGPFRPFLDLQRRAKQLALDENRAVRRLDATACLLRHGREQHVQQWQTPAYATAVPEVSVVVSLYDYADVIGATLDSIVASTDVALEVIVVDDHATDHSRAVASEYLADHPDVPMLLVGKDANAGLAAARNTGFELARSAFVMVMDADNQLYPRALRTLADRLLDEPSAAAAYCILEDFGAASGVRSALAWDVERLCAANYIDAQAMWRRAEWERLGGYRDDDQVFGWEDWDLWLRLADSGGHATLVSRILGRYRVQASSMIALTNLATDDAIVALHQRYPRLPWPRAV